MKQRIVIEIDGKDLPAYELTEMKGSNKDRPYNALAAFFEDIDYEVITLTIENLPPGPECCYGMESVTPPAHVKNDFNCPTCGRLIKIKRDHGADPR